MLRCVMVVLRGDGCAAVGLERIHVDAHGGESVTSSKQRVDTSSGDAPRRVLMGSVPSWLRQHRGLRLLRTRRMGHAPRHRGAGAGRSAPFQVRAQVLRDAGAQPHVVSTGHLRPECPLRRKQRHIWLPQPKYYTQPYGIRDSKHDSHAINDSNTVRARPALVEPGPGCRGGRPIRVLSAAKRYLQRPEHWTGSAVDSNRCERTLWCRLRPAGGWEERNAGRYCCRQRPCDCGRSPSSKHLPGEHLLYRRRQPAGLGEHVDFHSCGAGAASLCEFRNCGLIQQWLPRVGHGPV
mmetsp:Transcript_5923/g.24914  ORF Transcript_5923/g.24914 Transcript_5923/m.24914 type:complete len:293 (+) Transcript_5923:2693-3571(+)